VGARPGLLDANDWISWTAAKALQRGRAGAAPARAAFIQKRAGPQETQYRGSLCRRTQSRPSKRKLRTAYADGGLPPTQKACGWDRSIRELMDLNPRARVRRLEGRMEETLTVHNLFRLRARCRNQLRRTAGCTNVMEVRPFSIRRKRYVRNVKKAAGLAIDRAVGRLRVASRRAGRFRRSRVIARFRCCCPRWANAASKKTSAKGAAVAVGI